MVSEYKCGACLTGNDSQRWAKYNFQSAHFKSRGEWSNGETVGPQPRVPSSKSSRGLVKTDRNCYRVSFIALQEALQAKSSLNGWQLKVMTKGEFFVLSALLSFYFCSFCCFRELIECASKRWFILRSSYNTPAPNRSRATPTPTRSS